MNYQHCFHSLADTQCVGSVFRKSLVNYEEILLWDCEVVWLLAVKRRLRPEVCLSSYRDYCGNARVVHMSGTRGCCVTAGLDWHILREEKKDERIRMESVNQGQAVYSGFSQYCASDIWYVLQKTWRWDFSLRICAIIKTMVHLRMKTSWQRKSNPYGFLCWTQKITLGECSCSCFPVNVTLVYREPCGKLLLD